MSISLDETLVTLTQAARMLPGHPHVSTLWRWCRRGVKGIVLETYVVAGRRFTSTEALERFASATTAAANGEPPPAQTPRQPPNGQSGRPNVRWSVIQEPQHLLHDGTRRGGQRMIPRTWLRRIMRARRVGAFIHRIHRGW